MSNVAEESNYPNASSYGEYPPQATPYQSGQQYYPPKTRPHGNSVAPYPQYPQYPPYPPYPPDSLPFQQQPNLIIVNQAVPESRPTVSMTCAIVLSCFTFWIFGILFGGIAFILALVGQSAATAGDVNGAIRLRNASYGLSISGIIITVIIVVVVPTVIALTATTKYCYYVYE